MVWLRSVLLAFKDKRSPVAEASINNGLGSLDGSNPSFDDNESRNVQGRSLIMYVTVSAFFSVTIGLQPNPLGIGKGRTDRIATFGHT